MLADSKIESIFFQAIELPTDERASFVKNACHNDVSCIQEINSLLRASESSKGYFDELSGKLFHIGWEKNSTPVPKGRWVGAWRLQTLLGRGGMGSVYLADRPDQSYRKKVALKILPLGVDDPISRFRFTSEKQILAQLDHQNIARFIDGGVTECGTPYFVMDFIDGVCIDEYCSKLDVSLEKKLSFFLQICEAVEYAHQRMVVHRDLKPSNVLVDDNGNVKLLDFGIAKMIEANQPDLGLTKVASRPLTIAYASPEMLRGSDVDVTTDIYSLGVMLYQLVSGTLPYEQCECPIEHQRNIQRCLPSKPSAAARKNSKSKAIAGDLDSILLKAIDKSPNRRYSSVREFSQDIQRYLKGFPVHARPRSTFYQFGKFVRRHRTATFGVAAFATVLFFSSIFSFWQMVKAQQQRDLAQYQQRYAQASKEFLNLLFEEVGPKGKALSLEELLNQGVLMLDSQFSNPPVFVAQMYFELANSFSALGNRSKTEELISKAENVASVNSDYDLLSAIYCLRVDKTFRKDPHKARLYYAKAMDYQSKVSVLSISSTLVCRKAYARLLQSEQRFVEALHVIENAIDTLSRSNSVKGSQYLSLINRKTLMYYSLGDMHKVLQSNMELLSHMEASGRASTMGYLIALQNRAILLDTMGEVSASLELRKKIVKRFDEMDENSVPPRFTVRVADGLIRMGEFEKAFALYERSMAIFSEQGEDFKLAHIHMNMGKALVYLGRFDEAYHYINEAEKHYNLSPSANARQLHRVTLVKIASLRQQGNFYQALLIVKKLLSSMGYPEKMRGFELSQALREAARISIILNNKDDATAYVENYFKTAATLARNPKASADVGYAHLLLAELAKRAGNKNAAKAEIELAISALANGLGSEHEDTQRAMTALLQLTRHATGTTEKNQRGFLDLWAEDADYALYKRP